ncbi:MAG: patatin-like phospholipase family protein [Candidatus Omnitrophica bacterium]|nr:patatin-like phospholipase family protein [Candidatus Omnitrophota bacterium]
MNKKLINLACSVLVVLVCSGCATLRHPVPKDLIGKAHICDMPEIRTIMGSPNPVMQESIIRSIKDEDSNEYPLDSEGNKIYPLLAISGGAANGAYGAGLLKGWSAEGSRPKFKVITGVSTGAIIAPMVFLGKDYDCLMEQLYTTLRTKDVMKAKGPMRALFGNSLASNAPLEKELEKYITPDVIAQVAKEHNKGRRLFVGTTHLDAQRFVVWDMGAIAVRGDVNLFRKVILASAAIPVIFPPVKIHVEAEGCSYDELHVDGGAITQVFTIYKLLEHSGSVAKELGVDPSKVKGKMYIIRNGYVSPGYKVARENLPSLAGCSSDVMINSQGVGDTYRIYAFMKNRGNDYNLAFIPGDFRPEAKEMFDPCEMKQLFDKGYEDAVKGYKWHKTPPGLEEEKL